MDRSGDPPAPGGHAAAAGRSDAGTGPGRRPSDRHNAGRIGRYATAAARVQVRRGPEPSAGRAPGVLELERQPADRADADATRVRIDALPPIPSLERLTRNWEFRPPSILTPSRQRL